MAIGIDLMIPDVNETFYYSLTGEDIPCCDVCIRNGGKIYCPKLLCKWRDKKYSDYTEKYRRK